MRTVVRGLFTGRVAPLGPGTSAIDKQPRTGRVRITERGLDGDTVADTRHHGGPHKAVHHYPHDHVLAFGAERPHLAPALARPAPFGENVSTTGWTETDVHLSDTFRLGTAVVQVSQPRQPCWKLDERFADPGLARRVQATGRTGWYYRVLEEGTVEVGDPMVLLDRTRPAWPLARVVGLLFDAPLDAAALTALATVGELPPNLRALVARRLVTGLVEDWTARLTRPAAPPG